MQLLADMEHCRALRSTTMPSLAGRSCVWPRHSALSAFERKRLSSGYRKRNARMNLRAQFTQVGEVADPDLKKVHIEEELSSPVEKKKRVPNVSKTVLGIILGGGAGSRLYPLTKKRAKPAVPLGANYRLIDIPISNCLNSNVDKIYCLTQFNSASLNRHLSQAYNQNVGGYQSRGFVEVLAATQTIQKTEWFQGTADAVRSYLWLFEESVRDGVKDYLILSGDHLYRMNYEDFVAQHRETNADITIAALPTDEEQAEAFGVMKIDETGRITEFAEKVKGEKLHKMRVDTTVLGLDPERAARQPYIASMGIYVVKADVMQSLLMDKFKDANDFGSEVIPGAQADGKNVRAYLYDGYWEDIGTIKAFYDANLALTDNNPKFSFFDIHAPIYTMSRFLPPSKVRDSVIENSILGDGCVVKPGTEIKHSVIGLRSLIGQNCRIHDTLYMGADYYETEEECLLIRGCLPMGLGDNSEVRGAIIDKNARIGPNCKIINKDGVLEANREADGFLIKDGIVVVIKGSIIDKGTVI